MHITIDPEENEIVMTMTADEAQLVALALHHSSRRIADARQWADRLGRVLGEIEETA